MDLTVTQLLAAYFDLRAGFNGFQGLSGQKTSNFSDNLILLEE
jgi:hypothetical protein